MDSSVLSNGPDFDLGVIRLWTSGFQSVQTDGIILYQPWVMMVIGMGWTLDAADTLGSD